MMSAAMDFGRFSGHYSDQLAKQGAEIDCLPLGRGFPAFPLCTGDFGLRAEDFGLQSMCSGPWARGS